jgi:hypothetical protein
VRASLSAARSDIFALFIARDRVHALPFHQAAAPAADQKVSLKFMTRLSVRRQVVRYICSPCIISLSLCREQSCALFCAKQPRAATAHQKFMTLKNLSLHQDAAHISLPPNQILLLISLSLYAASDRSHTGDSFFSARAQMRQAAASRAARSPIPKIKFIIRQQRN